MFVHLRNHTHYSLLKALPKVPDLIRAAKNASMSAVAITDYSNMYGTIEFFSTCKKEGVKPIIGAEFTLLFRDRKFQIVLIAKNTAGYKNLMKITSIVNTDNPLDPILNDDILISHKDGLIVLSGGLWGDVNNLLIIDENLAKERLSFYKTHFNENYFLEINPQKKIDSSNEIRSATIKVAKETDTPLVATWNSHYLHQQDKPAQKILYLVQGTESSTEEYSNLFQKDVFAFETENIETFFEDAPEALSNTLKLLNSVN
jgi:DNA polymerase-3 subunit alpha